MAVDLGEIDRVFELDYCRASGGQRADRALECVLHVRFGQSIEEASQPAQSGRAVWRFQGPRAECGALAVWFGSVKDVSQVTDRAGDRAGVVQAWGERADSL